MSSTGKIRLEEVQSELDSVLSSTRKCEAASKHWLVKFTGELLLSSFGDAKYKMNTIGVGAITLGFAAMGKFSSNPFFKNAAENSYRNLAMKKTEINFLKYNLDRAIKKLDTLSVSSLVYVITRLNSVGLEEMLEQINNPGGLPSKD